MQCKHGFLVLHVDFDLVRGFGVTDCKGRMDDNLGFVGIRASSQKGADDSLLVRWAASAVVEDGEESLGVSVTLMVAFSMQKVHLLVVVSRLEGEQS